MKVLPLVLLAIRGCIGVKLGLSPNEVLMGRPLSIGTGAPNNSDISQREWLLYSSLPNFAVYQCTGKIVIRDVPGTYQGVWDHSKSCWSHHQEGSWEFYLDSRQQLQRSHLTQSPWPSPQHWNLGEVLVTNPFTHNHIRTRPKNCLWSGERRGQNLHHSEPDLDNGIWLDWKWDCLNSSV